MKNREDEFAFATLRKQNSATSYTAQKNVAFISNPYSQARNFYSPADQQSPTSAFKLHVAITSWLILFNRIIN